MPDASSNLIASLGKQATVDNMVATHQSQGTAAPVQTNDDERTPLLTRHDEATVPTVRSPLAIGIIMVAVVIFLGIGDQLMESPTTRLLESVCCYEYFQQHDPSQLLTDIAGAGPGALRGVAESSCKVNAVQGEVAMIRSYQFFLEGIPALALAVPFGWLQDKYGRRPFVLIGMFSLLVKPVWIMIVLWFWQAFGDMRWTWVSSVHALMMGGSPVVLSLYYTVLADITTAETRATIFLRLGASSLSTTFFTPIFTAWAMKFNPWIPMFGGLFVSIIGCVLTFLIPETLNYQHPDLDRSTEQLSVPIIGPILQQPAAPLDMQAARASLPWRLLEDIKEATHFLWEDYRVPVLILPFFIHMLLMMASQLLVQYASKRYDYTVATATMLVTIRSGVNIVILFSVIPAASELLMTKLGFSGKYKDLVITRASLAIMAIGWTLVGIASTAWLFVIGLVIISLGSGAMITLRSFLTSLVPVHQIARIYSIVCVVDTLGLMFGSPIMAEFFELGMAWGRAYIGLPFYTIGAVCFGFTLLMMFIRLRKDEHGPADLDESM